MTQTKPVSWEEAVLWLRQQPELQSVTVAGYYDDPLLQAAARYHESDEWLALEGLLPSSNGKSALDVGAGRGIASYALARTGFEVTALEPDGSNIVGANAIRRLAAESGLKIKVVQDISEQLPFESSQFDLVFARAVLHHTRSLPRACEEYFRVLRRGGRFIAIREHVISRPEDLPLFLAAHPLHRLYGGEHAYRLREYCQAIKSAGFRLKRVIAPFESAINLAPNTRADILWELARRLSRGSEATQRGLAAIFRTPGAWPLIRRALALIDNRPGRLYSFVAVRP